MSRWFPVLMAGLLAAASARANGLLIPTDSSIPPLALVRHEVKTHLVEQVASTEVTQVFRNHTDRALEANFVFPVPAGASVNRFAMWVDGKEVKGEMVEADKARQVYTDIVRRTQDPGLLEYIGQNLLRVRVFPVPANGEQKLALRFTAVCPLDAGLVEYCYPLKTDQKAAQVLEHFSIDATVESQHRVHNVYSPTHAVTVTPGGDHKSKVHFEAKQATLDRDLKLYFSLGNKDVGLTAMTHRPEKSKDGTFMLLISPRAELSKTQHVSRDIVFVLDVSGSMAGKKMEQAQKAVKHCLDKLHPNDRFGVIAFSTTVQRQHDSLQKATSEHVAEAKKWVDELESTGGTAIDDALNDALSLEPSQHKYPAQYVNDPAPHRIAELEHRPFTVVFFTDGQPTVGEQDPEKITQHVKEKKTRLTRIFTFGVGDDVNAALLDRLAEMTRSASAYVRPEEDIEAKTSSLFAKISHPVMTDLKLTAGAGVTLKEMYPKQLPDLFHGGQLVLLGKYKGHGHTALTLTGKVEGESKEIVYEVEFPEKTSADKNFVENLWARRKVGYLLDEIRNNGQQKELIDEVVKLAKKHGITTPYSSYLVVPDTVAAATPVTPASTPAVNFIDGGEQAIRAPRSAPAPSAAPPGGGTYPQADWVQYYQNHGYQINPGAGGVGIGKIRYAPVFVAPTGGYGDPITEASATTAPARAPAPTPVVATNGAGTPTGNPFSPAGPKAPVPAETTPPSGYNNYNATMASINSPEKPLPQAGKEGVELALQLKALQNESRPGDCKTCEAAGKTCFELNGAWIDESFKPGMKLVVVKAQSEAYFKLLAKKPELKDVFRLGNRLVWVTPSGRALVIDVNSGSDKLSDKEIDALFTAAKK